MLKALGVDSITVVPKEEVPTNTIGWEFYGVDGTHCALMTALLCPDAFPEGFEVWEPFAVGLEFLHDCVAKKETVDITLEDGYVCVTSGKSVAKRRQYTLDENPRVLPRFTPTNSVGILSDKLIDAAGKKYLMTNNGDLGLQVDLTEDTLTFTNSSERDFFSESYDILLSNLPDGPQSCHYGPEYLAPLMKALPKGIPMEVWMDEGKPIVFNIATEQCTMRIYIAPRIGN